MFFCRCGLLCRNCSRCRENCGINGWGVVEKGSSELLDEFLLCRCQEWQEVCVCRILCLGSICWIDVGIGLVLQVAGTGMAKTCEGILNAGQREQVYFTVGLVQVDVHAKIMSSVTVL